MFIDYQDFTGDPVGTPTAGAVAPGDLGWALCSTDQALYQNCGDNTKAGRPAAMEVFGGTSESSPLTAGEAALSTIAHNGWV